MKNMKKAQVNWLAGMLGILVILTSIVAVNQVSMKIGIIFGSLIIVATPFILWLSIILRHHDGIIHSKHKAPIL